MKHINQATDNSPIARLYRRKLLIVSIFLLVVIAGMTATMLITPKYEATMSLLVSRDRIDPQITSTDKTAEITQATISDEEFNSELELLQSIEVVTAVVKELDLVKDQKPKRDNAIGEWRGKIKTALYDLTSAKALKEEDAGIDSESVDVALERAVNRVSSNLDVEPTKKSRIIKVTYTDTDPMRAKRTLEALYRKFVDLHVDLNARGEAGEVFDQQTGKFDQQLNEATNKLKEFDTQNGVIGADISTQQGLLQKQLSDTQAQVNATRTQIGETVERIASLKSKIAAEPEQIQTGFVSKYVPAIDRMKEELSQLEQQRTQLLQKYQPNSRFVRENQERIDQLKKTLAAETANPPQERSFAINELRRRLEAELYEAQTNLVSLKDREKTLSVQTAKLSGEVTHLNTKTIERTSLERNRSVSEEAYLLYQKKARENDIGEVLNKEQIMNFALVDSPRTDGEKKTPKPLLNFLILLAVGSMAGLAGAIIVDRLTSVGEDHDLVSLPHQIESRLDLPLLASIPQMKVVGASRIRSSRPHLALPPQVIDVVESTGG